MFNTKPVCAICSKNTMQYIIRSQRANDGKRRQLSSVCVFHSGQHSCVVSARKSHSFIKSNVMLRWTLEASAHTCTCSYALSPNRESISTTADSDRTTSDRTTATSQKQEYVSNILFTIRRMCARSVPGQCVCVARL